MMPNSASLNNPQETNSMTTIADSDVENEGTSRDDAANALLSRWTDADPAIRDDEGAKPIRRSETERTPDAENESEDDDLDLDEEDHENDNDNEGDDPVEVADEALVKITVDGEDVTIPVKDLKRLYGQEASLTRKSQEVAENRRRVEENGARYVVATERLLNKAKERFEPYAQVDWAIAAKTLSNEDYVSLRQEATAAFTDLKFLNTELDTVFSEVTANRDAAALEDAKSALEVLQRDIPKFDLSVYQDMTKFAAAKGIPEQQFSQLTDPSALKMVHMAMSYERAKERAASKRSAAPTSKRTMKTTRRTDSRAGNREGDAMQRFKKSGSRDAAVAALMERWEGDGDQ
jgi:hypothetical protein